MSPSILPCGYGLLSQAWAPLPSAWPEACACVQKDFWSDGRALECKDGKVWPVQILNTKARQVMGSWTVTELAEMAHGRRTFNVFPCATVERLEWAACGRHLAVHCNHGWVLILTFDGAA